MKLYIANASKQDHLFAYMLPENPRPFSHSIRAGGQIVLDDDKDSIDAIIKQHEIYGMQLADKVGKGFGGLCYRIDKPVSIDAIKNGFTQSDQEMIDRAQQARTVTTVAADKMVAEKAQEMGVKQRGGLEFEVTEEKKSVADNEPKFEQTIEVIHEGVSPRRGRPRKSA